MPKNLQNLGVEICPQSDSILESLNGCMLHITKASGCFFQAMDMGVPTLLISHKSKDWYEFYKETNLVFYSTDNWLEIVSSIIRKKD